MALQTSSAVLFAYTIALGAALVVQNRRLGLLLRNDVTIHALMDVVVFCVFFGVTSVISSQIASLQKEHVELLLRKQQAMTTVFAGHADSLKNALMRENYSDVLAIVKESQRPARLFGVLTISNDGKWADHMITVLLFSVVGIVMKLLDDD
jgi:hypothetical protein